MDVHGFSRVYDALPLSGQRLLLEVVGLRNLAQSVSAWRALSRLRPTESWSREVQRAYVASRLRAMLKYAVHEVPRYDSMKWLARDLDDPGTDPYEVLRRFPVIEREELAAEPRPFRAHRFPEHLAVQSKTSGTTGSPLTVWVDRTRVPFYAALSLRRDVWAGYHRGDWVARLVGDPVIPMSEPPGRPAWRKASTDRRLYFSSFALDASSAVEICSVLAQVRPAFIMGYPSSLSALVGLVDADARLLRGWRPKAVWYSSEPLYPHQREAIGDFFQAPIRGFYGCAERVVSAAECSWGTYHLSLVDGYVEGEFTLRGTGAGPAVVTGLENWAMPLIRYRLSDRLGFRTEGECPCGCTLPSLSPVVTKAEDCVVTPAGRIVSPSALTWAFKDVDGLLAAQIVQTRVDGLVVRCRCRSDVARDAAATAAANVRRIVGSEMDVEYELVEELELTRAGKTRFVVADDAILQQRARFC